MLVDDNETNNYVGERIIKKAQFSRRKKVSYSIRAALSYLQSNQDKLIEISEVIFLDVYILVRMHLLLSMDLKNLPNLSQENVN